MERMAGSTGNDAYEMGQFAVQHVGTSPPDVLMHNDVLLIILPNVGHDDTTVVRVRVTNRYCVPPGTGYS